MTQVMTQKFVLTVLVAWLLVIPSLGFGQPPQVTIRIPTVDQNGEPLTDLFNVVVFVSKAGVGNVRIMEFRVDRIYGTEDLINLWGLSGDLTLQAIAFSTSGKMSAPSGLFQVTVPDEQTPGKPEIRLTPPETPE